MILTKGLLMRIVFELVMRDTTPLALAISLSHAVFRLFFFQENGV